MKYPVIYHLCINTIFRHIKHEKSWFITDNRWYIFEYITKLQYTRKF